MNFELSVVIPTIRRYQSLNRLLSQLSIHEKKFEEIIVVDSTPRNELAEIIPLNNLIYLRTDFRNGLYQRYLGFKACTADFILFLDDDMEVANENFYDIIKKVLYPPDVSGLAINFENKNKDTSLSMIPKSALFDQGSNLKKIINWLTSYPNLKDGKYGLCGNRGRQPAAGGPTQWLSGGAFAAKRSRIFQNFNLQFCDLFEQKLGMGEDPLIGYNLCKHGDLIYDPTLLFYHNDQKNSNYSLDHFSYSQRVIFSRLFLSLEKTRLDKGNFFFAKVNFHWYTLWRITGLMLNYFLTPSKINKKMLGGAILGWIKSILFRFDLHLKRNSYWNNQALNDLQQIK